MKRLHVARHSTEAHLVRGFLESCGIAAVVRGDHLTGGWGELPLDVCSVWVADTERFGEAERLLRDFLDAGPAPARGAGQWTCSHCGEALEGQFTDCWRCGRARPGD